MTGHFEWGTTGTFTAYLPRHSTDLPGNSYQTVQAEHDPLSSSFVAPMIDVPVNRVALRPSTHVAGGTQVFYIAGGDLGAIGTDATVTFSHGTSTSSATGDASKVFNVKEAKVVSWDGYNDSLVKAVRVTVDIASTNGLDGTPDTSPDNTDGANLTSDQIVGLWDVTVTSGNVSGLLMPEVMNVVQIDFAPGYYIGSLKKVIGIPTMGIDKKDFYLGYVDRLDATHPAHLMIYVSPIDGGDFVESLKNGTVILHEKGDPTKKCINLENGIKQDADFTKILVSLQAEYDIWNQTFPPYIVQSIFPFGRPTVDILYQWILNTIGVKTEDTQYYWQTTEWVAPGPKEFVIAGGGWSLSARLEVANIVADTNRDGQITDDDNVDAKQFWDKNLGAYFMVNCACGNGQNVPDNITFDSDGTPITEKNTITTNGINNITPMVVHFKDPTNKLKVYIRAKKSDLRAVHLYKRIQANQQKYVVTGGPNDTNKMDNALTEIEITPDLDPSGTTTMGLEGLFFRYMMDGENPQYFKGEIDLEVVVKSGTLEMLKDKVHLKVAPFIMLPNKNDAEQLWVASTRTVANTVDGNEYFTSALLGSGKLKGYVRKAEDTEVNDQWAQDHVEIGYTGIPTKKIHVALRLPRAKVVNDQPVDTTPTWPLAAFENPDFGTYRFRNTIQFDGADSGDFGGNLEILPLPMTSDCPLGRICVGSTISDKLFNFLNDQEVQKPIKVDTDWLEVGHVDEMFGFMSSSIAVADTDLAKQLLSACPADAVFFAVGNVDHGQSTGLGTTSTLVHNGKDFRNGGWKIIRIYAGKGAGQVAYITPATGLNNGFVTIAKVWNTGSKVISAGGMDIASYATNQEVPTQATWFVIPDETSQYVIVQDCNT